MERRTLAAEKMAYWGRKKKRGLYSVLSIYLSTNWYWNIEFKKEPPVLLIISESFYDRRIKKYEYFFLLGMMLFLFFLWTIITSQLNLHLWPTAVKRKKIKKNAQRPSFFLQTFMSYKYTPLQHKYVYIFYMNSVLDYEITIMKIQSRVF